MLSRHVLREIEMWDKLTSSPSTPVGAIRTRADVQAARDQA